MSALPHRRYTEAEYLAFEEKATERHQFVDGEIFNMAGAEPEHVLVVANLTAALTIRFRGKPYQTFPTDMRVRAGEAKLWTYPDLSALCGRPSFDTSARPSSLLNPQVIVEVLSPSTEAFDRGDKFARYRCIESLCEYVLVSSR